MTNSRGSAPAGNDAITDFSYLHQKALCDVMKELRAIIDAFDQIDFSRKRAALATVVKVRGSSYRSPGARMLITDDGHWTGSISGGCLEGDALRKARQIMADGKPMTVTYDTREESHQNLGVSLGCNGVIDVLLEPIDPSKIGHPIALLRAIVAREEHVTMATFFAGPFTGTRYVESETGVSAKALPYELFTALQSDLAGLVNRKSSATARYDVDGVGHEAFLEVVQPSVALIIFGGGFDARPVAQLAKSMGWNVNVTDECVAHIAPVFFPSADKLSLCQREHVDRDFAVTATTACVLMSHNYEYDRDVLRKLLKTPAPYIGILGPRKRFDKMVAELSVEGTPLSANDHHRIHSPIGLDIGAETPDEIALSIIAEIQSKFANRSGGFLKYRNGPIHRRGTNGDEVIKEVYIAEHAGTGTQNT